MFKQTRIQTDQTQYINTYPITEMNLDLESCCRLRNKNRRSTCVMFVNSVEAMPHWLRLQTKTARPVLAARSKRWISVVWCSAKMWWLDFSCRIGEYGRIWWHKVMNGAARTCAKCTAFHWPINKFVGSEQQHRISMLFKYQDIRLRLWTNDLWIFMWEKNVCYCLH